MRDLQTPPSRQWGSLRGGHGWLEASSDLASGASARVGSMESCAPLRRARRRLGRLRDDRRPDPRPARSFPRSPKNWSLPEPPEIESFPSPSKHQSSPSPASSESLPATVQGVLTAAPEDDVVAVAAGHASSSSPAEMKSFPPSPLITSCPPKPRIQSGPAVPVRWSLLEVSMMTCVPAGQHAIPHAAHQVKVA